MLSTPQVTIIKTIPVDHISSTTISPDGEFAMICTTPSYVHITNVIKKEVVGTFLSDVANISHCIFSIDNSKIYIGGAKGYGEIWLFNNGQKIEGEEHKFKHLCSFNNQSNIGSIMSSAFSPNGLYLITESFRDPCTYLHSIENPSFYKAFRDDGYVYGSKEMNGCMFSPDSAKILYPYEDKVKIWSIETNKFVCILKPPVNTRLAKVNHCEYSRDGKFIVACYTNGGVNMWNAETGKYIKSFAVSDKPYSKTTYMSILGAKTIQDGHVIISKNRVRTKRKARIRRSTKDHMEDVISFKDEIVRCSISSDSSQLICTNRNNELSLWCIETGECINKVTAFRDDNNYTSSCLFRDDEPVYIEITSNISRLMSLRTGKSLGILKDVHDSRIAWHFSNDGKIAIALDHHNITTDANVWDLSDVSVLHTFRLKCKSNDVSDGLMANGLMTSMLGVLTEKDEKVDVDKIIQSLSYGKKHDLPLSQMLDEIC